MKRWVSCLLICSLAVLLAAACGSKEGGKGGSSEPSQTATSSADPADLKGTITMGTNRTDIVDTEFPKWAEKFNEKYPNVEVKFEAYADLAKDLKVRIASGDWPDISLNPGIKKEEFPDYFASLDDMGLNDSVLFKDVTTYDGKLYGIVTGVVPYIVTYNKRTFERAGITEIPKTWDAFLAACEKLKALGDVVPLATNFKEAWTLQPWLLASGLIDNDPDLYNSWVKTDTPFRADGGMGKSIALFQELNAKGYLEKELTSTNWMQTFPDMANGKIGMVWLGSYMKANAINIGNGKDEDFGYFPMPLDNSENNSVILTPDLTYVVNKDSKNLEAAKAFLKFIILESGYNDYAGLMSPIKDHPNADMTLQEMLDAKPTIFEVGGAEDDYTAIANKAQLDLFKMMQEYTLAEKPAEVMDKYNKKWADAKKELGK